MQALRDSRADAHHDVLREEPHERAKRVKFITCERCLGTDVLTTAKTLDQPTQLRFTRRGIPTSPKAAVELAQLAMRYSDTVELETPMRPLIPLLARLGSSRTAGHSTAMR